MDSKHEALCESHLNFENALNNFCIKLPSLQIIQSNAQSLTKNIESSWSLAENVTGKIRKLDIIRNRVQGCLRKVEDLLDLKLCTIGVNMAMKDMDYEKAASHINRFLELDKNSLLISTPNDKTQNQLRESFETLNKAKDNLKLLINNKFDEAIAQNDRAELERLFKLFPLLHAQNEGLKKFAKYICSQYVKACQPSMDLMDKSGGDKPLYYSEILTNIFDNHVNIVQTNQPMIEASYKKGNMELILESLQIECDKLTHSIFLKMESDFALKARIKNINVTNRSNIPQDDSSVNVSKDLDFILDEISLCITQAQYFFQYLEVTIKNDKNESATQDTLHLTSSHANYINNLALCCDIQQLMAQYITLEEYFMKRNFVKARELDRFFGEGHVTSSIVDDVFFIIKKCIQRSINTSHTDVVCAMVNHAGNLLENDYFTQTLETRLRDGFVVSKSTGGTGYGVSSLGSTSSYYSNIVGGVLVDLSHAAYTTLLSPSTSHATSADATPQFPTHTAAGPYNTGERGGGGGGVVGSTTSRDPQAGISDKGGRDLSTAAAAVEQEIRDQIAFMTTLNNVELSQKYMKKLVQDMEEEILMAISHLNNYDQSKDKILHCLSNLTLSDKVIQNMLQRGLRSISDNLLRSKTKHLIENINTVKHNLTEEDLALYQVHDPWIQPLLAEIRKLTLIVKNHLSPTLFEKLMAIYVSDIPIYLENILMKTKFNRLGSLFFDKELRTLINYMTSLTSSWATRDKFSRLLQINMVLNVNKVSDIVEYCTSSNNIVWKLTPTDMQQVLLLRVDLPKEEIQKLKL